MMSPMLLGKYLFKADSVYELTRVFQIFACLRHRSADWGSLAHSCGCFRPGVLFRFTRHHFLFAREYRDLGKSFFVCDCRDARRKGKIFTLAAAFHVGTRSWKSGGDLLQKFELFWQPNVTSLQARSISRVSNLRLEMNCVGKRNYSERETTRQEESFVTIFL